MSQASKDLIRRLRDARERLRATNINDPALAVCISGLRRIEEALSRPLSVVIVGEYNSGKTSVADLLIGDGVLPTSVVSNTRVPVLIMHAETAALYGVDADDTLIRIDSDDDDPLIDIPYRALKIGLPIERLRDYQILETFEAGIVLRGTEVKSLRAGRGQIRDAFARVENDEVYLYNAHIDEYAYGNQLNHPPKSVRKLLLHRAEIRKLLS